MLDNLLKLLVSGQDSPLLRFGIGSAFFKLKDYEQAVEHLEEAVQQDPDYSAAWKLYGRSLMQLGRDSAAEQAFVRGIEVASRKGDVQAVKEMQVFMKRLKS